MVYGFQFECVAKYR